jgi:hypothetical protein
MTSQFSAKTVSMPLSRDLRTSQPQLIGSAVRSHANNKTLTADWSTALSVNRCTTQQQPNHVTGSAAGNTSENYSRPVRDEVIIRAVSAKASLRRQQRPHSASRSKANAGSTSTGIGRKQRSNSDCNGGPENVYSSLVIRPVALQSSDLPPSQSNPDSRLPMTSPTSGDDVSVTGSSAYRKCQQPPSGRSHMHQRLCSRRSRDSNEFADGQQSAAEHTADGGSVASGTRVLDVFLPPIKLSDDL